MEKLMLGDYRQDLAGEIIGKVTLIEEDSFCFRAADGVSYHGGNTRPVFITDEWINKANSECEKHGVVLDWSRSHKLKVSCIETNAEGKKKVQISFFYPKPRYVHQLQKILRDFDDMEI